MRHRLKVFDGVKIRGAAVGGGVSVVVVVTSNAYRGDPWQKAKKTTGKCKKKTPPIENKTAFGLRLSASDIYITFRLSISIIFLPLGMLIEIHNRIPIGLAVGFSIFPSDDEHEETLVILYLLIIEIRLAW